MSSVRVSSFLIFLRKFFSYYKKLYLALINLKKSDNEIFFFIFFDIKHKLNLNLKKT